MSALDKIETQSRARLPRHYEDPYQTVVKESDIINQTVEAQKLRGERVRKVKRIAGLVLALAGAGVVTESHIVARTANSLFNSTANEVAGPSIPSAEDASPIYIGDTIEYKTPDGKPHKMRVRIIADITRAATEVKPDLSAGTFDAMLESENNNSLLVHNGDKFTVDKNLGITDLGPSGE